MTVGDGPFAFREKTSCRVVGVHGEQDLASAPELARALAEAAAHPGSQVRVDLQAVTFMDCAGIRPLLQAQETLGDRLCLWNPSPAVTRLLQLADLFGTFAVFSDPAVVAELYGALVGSADRYPARESSPWSLPGPSPSRPAPHVGPASPRTASRGDRRRWWHRRAVGELVRHA